MTAGQGIVRQNHNSRVLEDPLGLSSHASSLFLGQKKEMRRKDKTTKANVLWAVWRIHRGKVNPPPVNGEPRSPSSSVPLLTVESYPGDPRGRGLSFHATPTVLRSRLPAGGISQGPIRRATYLLAKRVKTCGV